MQCGAGKNGGGGGRKSGEIVTAGNAKAVVCAMCVVAAEKDKINKNAKPWWQRKRNGKKSRQCAGRQVLQWYMVGTGRQVNCSNM